MDFGPQALQTKKSPRPELNSPVNWMSSFGEQMTLYHPDGKSPIRFIFSLT